MLLTFDIESNEGGIFTVYLGTWIVFHEQPENH